MANTTHITLATTVDALAIADLSRRTFYDSFAEYNTKENMDLFLQHAFSRETLIAEVGPPNIFLLAWMDAKLAGYAKLQDLEQPPELEGMPAMEIVRIYSEKQAIGKGIGRALMLRILDIARSRNKHWVWLGVWEHNQRAIDFYTKWGFEKFGQHIFMVGTDPQTDWYMKKKI